MNMNKTKLPNAPGVDGDDAQPVAGSARGRPKDLEKRAAILSAATDLFTARGLNGVSMEAVARAAGVSKITVYSHFRSKDELFRETVFAKCRQHWPEALFDVGKATPLDTRLRRIATGFHDLVFGSEVLDMYRLMAAQSSGPSRFGRLFWQSGPELTMSRFAAVLEAAHKAGELEVPDPVRAATHFFILLKGDFHIKCLVGAAQAPSRAMRQRHAEDVIALFLKAYAPTKPGQARSG